MSGLCAVSAAAASAASSVAVVLSAGCPDLSSIGDFVILLDVMYRPGMDVTGCDTRVCAAYGVCSLSATGSVVIGAVSVVVVASGLTVVIVCIRALETSTCASDTATSPLGTVSVVAPAVARGSLALASASVTVPSHIL